MIPLNEKALEAAARWNGVYGAQKVIAAYFGSLAEQDVHLVDVRKVVELVRASDPPADDFPHHWIAAVIEERFGRRSSHRATSQPCKRLWVAIAEHRATVVHGARTVHDVTAADEALWKVLDA